MELKREYRLTFRKPVTVFTDYVPGMSPYVHRWMDLNDKLSEEGEDGPPLSEQTDRALRALIDGAFGGGDGKGPETTPESGKPDSGRRLPRSK